MLTRLLRLLAPLAARRRSRLFPIVRTGRFQTGLFRSRRHPDPSPRAPTQPLQRPPATPAQPQPPSPTRPKIRPKLSLASPPPLGAGWREIAPPSPPPNPHHPAQHLSPIQSPPPTPRRTAPPRHNLNHPCHPPDRPSPGPPRRLPESAENHPAAPQEFFRKNSYCARDPRFRRSGRHPSSAPASTPSPRPTTLAGTHQTSEPA